MPLTSHISLTLCALLAFTPPKVAKAVEFDVAIYTGHGFELYNVTSGVVHSVPCGIPVGSFSIAPSGEFLVFSSASTAGMGLLYEINLASGRIRQLPSGAFYFKNLPKGEREMYSDAAVSPDGASVAFTIHDVAGNESDDLVGLSGPLGLMNMRSGRRWAVTSTAHVMGEFPAFVNNPVWSADGRNLLIAFETGGAVVNVADGKMRVIDDTFVTKQLGDGFVSPMTWWSDHEILSVWNSAESEVSGNGQLYLLNLQTNSIVPAALPLRIPEQYTQEVLAVEVTSKLLLLRHANGSELFNREGRLIKRWEKGEAPRMRLYR